MSAVLRYIALHNLGIRRRIGKLTKNSVRRFDSSKTKEDYKFQFRARSQKPKEDFDGFGDSLMELVRNGYPGAAYTFKVEHVSDQFIQGVTSRDDIRHYQKFESSIKFHPEQYLKMADENYRGLYGKKIKFRYN